MTRISYLINRYQLAKNPVDKGVAYLEILNFVGSMDNKEFEKFYKSSDYKHLPDNLKFQITKKRGIDKMGQ